MTIPVVVNAVGCLCDLADLAAIALVGSWARGDQRADSDIDLIVLTENPERLLDHDDWYAAFGADAKLIRANSFGVIQERRLGLPDGLVIEVGVGTPDWAAIDPVDGGTAAVVRHGLVPLFDPRGLLAQLVEHLPR